MAGPNEREEILLLGDPRLRGIFSVTVTALISHEGHPVGTVMVMRDVTEEARLEAERAGLRQQLVDPADDFYWYENAGTAKSRGLELGLNARLPNEVLGYASYSYQDSTYAASDSRLTNSPVHLVKAGVSFPVFRCVYMGLQILHESERLTVYGTKTKPFFLANLNLASKPFFKHLRASLLINNLFDVQYAYAGGYEHLQDAIIQDGRNFIFRLDYMF